MKNIYFNAIYLAVLLTGVLFWQGCNVINPHEQVPTYIHVDSFQFSANPLQTGVTTSHSITTVWAYYNNNLIGTYDLPANIPVITKGDSATGTLILSPGIRVNGQNDNIANYPFYAVDTFTFAAQPGKVLYHNPKTMLYSAAKVYRISNFEGAITGFAAVNSTKPMTIAGDSLAFEGQYSGMIELGAPTGSSVDSSLDSSRLSFSIPYGQSSFLEFDYKGTLPFYIGFQVNEGAVFSSTVRYLTGVNTSDQWQKFYLFLGDFAAQFQGTSYNLYIKASLPAGNTTGGRVLLDNIQIVSF